MTREAIKPAYTSHRVLTSITLTLTSILIPPRRHPTSSILLNSHQHKALRTFHIPPRPITKFHLQISETANQKAAQFVHLPHTHPYNRRFTSVLTRYHTTCDSSPFFRDGGLVSIGGASLKYLCLGFSLLVWRSWLFAICEFYS